MQQVAGFTPQTNTFGPHGQGKSSSSMQATGMGRQISRQESTHQMMAAPLSVAGSEQALPARNVQAIPAVDSWLSKGLPDPVEALWAMSRFSMEVHQRATSLDVQLQVVNDAFENLFQAGATKIDRAVSDKVHAVRDQLKQLESDYGEGRKRAKMLGDYETAYLHKLNERTEKICGGARRPVVSEAMVSQAHSARVESIPQLIVSRAHSAQVESAPYDIQPQHSAIVESEVVPHFLQPHSDQMVDVDSRIAMLEQSYTEASAPTMNIYTTEASAPTMNVYITEASAPTMNMYTTEAGAPTMNMDDGELSDIDDIKQRLVAVSDETVALKQEIDQHIPQQGPEHKELKSALTNLFHRIDGLHESTANAETKHRQELHNLIEAHHRELESCRAAQQDEIGDIQARYQDRMASLQEELHSSHERIEKMNESIRADEARLQSDGLALSDVQVNELREAVALRSRECALLEERTRNQQISYDALVASHQVDMDKAETAHQRDLELLKQEHQTQLQAQDEQISKIQIDLDRYRTLIDQQGDVIFSKEETVANFEAQLQVVTAATEKLTGSYESARSKHRDVRAGLYAGRDQLAETLALARGLADELTEHKLAAELAVRLEECSVHFANLKEDVDGVQLELDEVRRAVGRAPTPTVETESSTADESDIARTYISHQRREAEV